MPRTPDTERLSAILTRGGLRKLELVFDERDRPLPYTAELRVDGRLVGIRSGKTLQEAITLVKDAVPPW